MFYDFLYEGVWSPEPFGVGKARGWSYCCVDKRGHECGIYRKSPETDGN